MSTNVCGLNIVVKLCRVPMNIYNAEGNRLNDYFNNKKINRVLNRDFFFVPIVGVISVGGNGKQLRTTYVLLVRYNDKK